MTLYAQELQVEKYSTTEPMKVGELAHGAVTVRRAPSRLPSTALFGAWLMRQASDRLRQRGGPPSPRDVLEVLESRRNLRFYPALVQTERMLGVFQCEKSTCTVVDFVSLAAYTASLRPPKLRRELRVGIYIDRAVRSGKYGAMYAYYVTADAVGLVTAAPPLGDVLVLGYKKTYGLGEAEVKSAAPVAPISSNRFLLLAPAPLSALVDLKPAGLRAKYYPRYYIYLLITNKFYVMGRHFDEPYAAPGTEIVLNSYLTPLELWHRIAEQMENMKVWRQDGRPERDEDVADLVKAKAKAALAAPVALVPPRQEPKAGATWSK